MHKQYLLFSKEDDFDILHWYEDDADLACKPDGITLFDLAGDNGLCIMNTVSINLACLDFDLNPIITRFMSMFVDRIAKLASLYVVRAIRTLLKLHGTMTRHFSYGRHALKAYGNRLQ